MDFNVFEKSYAPRVDKKQPPLDLLRVVETPKELSVGKDIWIDYDKMTRWSISNHNNEDFEDKTLSKVKLVKLRVRGMMKEYDSLEGYKAYRKFLLDAIKRRSIYVYKR